MKVTLLKKNLKTYTCNVYFVQGDWNTISDINTLIDVGTDSYIIEEIETLSTGVGKKRVEQIILTHEHFDHAGGLKKIKEVYKPTVIAFSKMSGIDIQAYDGMKVKLGDSEATLLYTPGHSNDSLSIYCEKEQILFSGDTQLNIKTPGGTYTPFFIDVLQNLIKLPIKIIYSGHDEPLTHNVSEVLKNTLHNVRKSKLIL